MDLTPVKQTSSIPPGTLPPIHPDKSKTIAPSTAAPVQQPQPVDIEPMSNEAEERSERTPVNEALPVASVTALADVEPPQEEALENRHNAATPPPPPPFQPPQDSIRAGLGASASSLPPHGGEPPAQEPHRPQQPHPPSQQPPHSASYPASVAPNTLQDAAYYTPVPPAQPRVLADGAGDGSHPFVRSSPLHSPSQSAASSAHVQLTFATAEAAEEAGEAREMANVGLSVAEATPPLLAQRSVSGVHGREEEAQPAAVEADAEATATSAGITVPSDAETAAVAELVAGQVESTTEAATPPPTAAAATSIVEKEAADVIASPVEPANDVVASADATATHMSDGQLGVPGALNDAAVEDSVPTAAAWPAPADPPAALAPSSTPAAADAEAWVIDFGAPKPKPKRKMTKKEKDAIKESRVRSQAATETAKSGSGAAGGGGLGADSEGNAVLAQRPAFAPSSSSAAAAKGRAEKLQVVRLDGLADRDALVPTNLTTVRADLEQRLVLRMPRLLCVNKQYPRGCGIASLTSVYNYLYSWLGESTAHAHQPPHSQEEMMSILGFEPPFGEISWGPFTGNTTLIRWFHALNRHFGNRGRAYILYKAHGHGKTTHLYPDNAAALKAVKAALRDPHCALIYHCHNHYMVPVGYQEIPHAQVDFLQPSVPETSCETTVFIGEVSRGRHEAMYARKWEQIVKDIECKSPMFFNIRHPELGVQRREPKSKKKEADAAAEGVTAKKPRKATAVGERGASEEVEVVAVAPAPATTPPPPPTLVIPMPSALRDPVTESTSSTNTVQQPHPERRSAAAEEGSNEKDEGVEPDSTAPEVEAALASSEEGLAAVTSKDAEEVEVVVASQTTEVKSAETPASSTAVEAVPAADVAEPAAHPEGEPQPAAGTPPPADASLQCATTTEEARDAAAPAPGTAEANEGSAAVVTRVDGAATPVLSPPHAFAPAAPLTDSPPQLLPERDEAEACPVCPVASAAEEEATPTAPREASSADARAAESTVEGTCAAADASDEAAAAAPDDIEPANPPASPVGDAEASLPVLDGGAPRTVAAAVRADDTASPPCIRPRRASSAKAAKANAAAAAAASAAPPAKPKKEGGNLHCLIIFRNDDQEERLDRYEDTPAAGAPPSSSSDSDDSSSSDEDEY